ncbi:DUF4382 domain-containing protein [Pedobacter sp. P351]|uniref:DUF4382 domain-containing protein n=1 Tax=Pedobacter superstes TaxID=3133441 RepID=UPI0030991A63
MKRFFIISALLVVVAFTACKDDNSSSVTKFSVKMTDAPGAYQSLMLNVKEIQVLTSEGTSTLPVGTDPFDILHFRMGKDTLLASQDIPAGQLQEIRLVLNETGNTVVIDDVAYNLTTPSAQSSGLKLKVNADLNSGSEYTLLLDFDAAKSIVKTGNGKYILKPVIRVIPQAVSGSLRGIIIPASSSPKIYAITGTDTIGTISDATGNFYFPGLKAGVYKVNIEPVSPYQFKSIENVSVVNGSTNNIGTITLVQ